jgi:hypothetical protein
MQGKCKDYHKGNDYDTITANMHPNCDPTTLDVHQDEAGKGGPGKK